MRITYLHQYFNTLEMSGSTRSYEMARRLVAIGHQVNMVTSWREDNGSRNWFETEEAGIRVHWLPVPYSNNMSYKERIRAFLRFAWGAAHKAASLPADVVFASSTPLTIALPGAYAAKRRNTIMVFEVRDLWPELPIAIGALKNPLMRAGARWLERFAYSRSEHLVALSPGIKAGVIASGFPADRVSVIPNSSDLEFFDPDAADPTAFRNAHPEIGDGFLVVYTGTMGRINGVAYLARIAATAMEMGSKLTFLAVGRGQEESKIRAEAKRLGVYGNNFFLYPPSPKREMPNILACADVALSLFINLKPMWANSANKFFDALASGTPVAINYGGWQAELLKGSGAGLVLPPEDAVEAARQLEKFIMNREMLAVAGQKARKLAEEHFDREKLAAKLEGVLHGVQRAESFSR